ncbi:AsnC family transcriptional regulator [Ectothiorhodospira haloalkaliphila]|uniref:AsnC family transcriptional regulator n=1 Tax=Ectothiorhodospira haloalkaliphila TaxID=421628 RepID=W8KH42_9GAMM|nr:MULTISPECIES: Lrp/AsnC ligand binding domain-containing protein [Ectothiorhodospira]AHK78488.1 AsnC family transcriptional regulator [Ectothiorhodospira haloalkaliphila]MCG5495595.1 Lrp/AsnC ligand binding domain-containing protein [Ectothiorhodospira variabilis]MCG5498367.1 Lrp/AsnC ligand binding domain-containing protein [Ectothiorhodospira variabilis]MCG5503063.1 Lrp/AsnC ligand binding domain-containing protein [Ectothiorhodospira variabilis]MCG5506178.1 Lrp/AsnC ligand binding domain-
MVTAIILMNVQRQKINQIAEELADMEQITEVFSVSGQYDLIAIARVPRNDDLAEVVTRRLLTIDGLEKTNTLLAFKAYSRHDLEAMFSV